MRIHRHHRSCTAALTIDLMIAMALLAIAVFPLTASYVAEQKEFKVYSARAAAIEASDGEFELLYELGRFPTNNARVVHLPISPGAAKLAPGNFLLEREGKRLQLTWTPKAPDHGGIVKKEMQLP
ncbi:MAG: hypothetical protein JWN25_989 [Verrucomicrobiales bacterium]|nr:hypothetical protein [Verrucomicrobiales bacterium]MDB6130169.1 hypothetical protein [Verrucomicrobiales bacterium]